MSNNDFRKDRSIIRHILKYCQEADAAVDYFGNDESAFMSNPVYRNAVSMPIQQIGELAKHLSDDFHQCASRHPMASNQRDAGLVRTPVSGYGRRCHLDSITD